MSTRKAPKAKLAPVPPKLLRAQVLIEETAYTPPPWGAQIVARGVHPDNTPYAVIATLSDLTIHLYTRDRHIRSVSISSLMEAINEATKVPPSRKRGTR